MNNDLLCFYGPSPHFRTAAMGRIKQKVLALLKVNRIVSYWNSLEWVAGCAGMEGRGSRRLSFSPCLTIFCSFHPSQGRGESCWLLQTPKGLRTNQPHFSFHFTVYKVLSHLPCHRIGCKQSSHFTNEQGKGMSSCP